MGCRHEDVCDACGLDYIPVSNRQRICKICTPNKGWQARFRRYGISKPVFDLMFEKQEGKCLLCLDRLKDFVEGQKDLIAIDHDHLTGEVRGLLCFPCNYALHRFEDPEYVARVFKYLNLSR